MFLPVAYLERRVSIVDVVKALFVAFFGNLAGMLLFLVIIHGGGVFDDEVFRKQAIKFATKKAYEPQWHQIFLKAIGGEYTPATFIPCGTNGVQRIGSSA